MGWSILVPPFNPNCLPEKIIKISIIAVKPNLELYIVAIFVKLFIIIFLIIKSKPYDEGKDQGWVLFAFFLHVCHIYKGTDKPFLKVLFKK